MALPMIVRCAFCEITHALNEVEPFTLDLGGTVFFCSHEHRTKFLLEEFGKAAYRPLEGDANERQASR